STDGARAKVSDAGSTEGARASPSADGRTEGARTIDKVAGKTDGARARPRAEVRTEGARLRASDGGPATAVAMTGAPDTAEMGGGRDMGGGPGGLATTAMREAMRSADADVDDEPEEDVTSDDDDEAVEVVAEVRAPEPSPTGFEGSAPATVIV